MTQKQLSDKIDVFVKKYQGKVKGYPTDEDYQGQCLSLVKLYIQEVFDFDAPPSGSNSAYGYWTNFPFPLTQYFTKVENTPTGVPEKGCIPIWNTSMGGGYGHIDIFISGDVNSFYGFDQNWGGKEAHMQSHGYENVVGWLKPKLDDEKLISVEMLPKDSIIRDIRMALCGSFSQNEITADLKSGKNILQITKDICQGDEKFFNKWIKPSLPLEKPPVSSPEPTRGASTSETTTTYSQMPYSTTGDWLYNPTDTLKLNIFQKVIRWFLKLLG